MSTQKPSSWTAFAGHERIAAGGPQEIVPPCKTLLDAGDARAILIFDDSTAEPVEIDFRGSEGDVIRRLSADTVQVVVAAGQQEATPLPRPPGRPKLGVVGREVTLLPRHWEWLNAQPGGASVALRKLVEQARKENRAEDRVRRAQEVAFRFMSAMAGNEAGYEEACRALFAGSKESFTEHISSWPPDVRDYAVMLAADAFGKEEVLTG